MAVAAGSERLTYGALAGRALRLARALRDRGVGPETVVPLVAVRSPEMVVGLLGILAAGGAYVPLDREAPAGRSARMLRQARARWLVADGPVDPGWGFEGEVLEIPRSAGEPEDPEVPGLDGANLAYVVFTSGSSGEPKGVMIDHGELARLCLGYRDRFGIEAASRVLLLFPFTFDAAVKNVLAPLTVGGRLVLPPPGPFHPLKILELIERRRITHLNCVPSAAYPILQLAARDGYRGLRSLRMLGLGGEVVNTTPLAGWIASKTCRCRVVNLYGPAECTDLTTAAELTPQVVARGGPAPLGRPLFSRRVEVLAAGRPLPEGRVGELSISGAGLSRGYFDDPARTAERFVPSAHAPGGRLYRTGDLASRNTEGELIFHGRADQQVKVRGFRVELGEIEASLLRLPGVFRAAVVPRGEAPRFAGLAAWVVSDGALDSVELKRRLSDDLPPYMVPQSIVLVDRLPSTPHGKIDREALRRWSESGAADEPGRSPRAITG